MRLSLFCALAALRSSTAIAIAETRARHPSPHPLSFNKVWPDLACASSVEALGRVGAAFLLGQIPRNELVQHGDRNGTGQGLLWGVLVGVAQGNLYRMPNLGIHNGRPPKCSAGVCSGSAFGREADLGGPDPVRCATSASQPKAEPGMWVQYSSALVGIGVTPWSTCYRELTPKHIQACRQRPSGRPGRRFHRRSPLDVQ